MRMGANHEKRLLKKRLTSIGFSEALAKKAAKEYDHYARHAMANNPGMGYWDFDIHVELGEGIMMSLDAD